MDEAKQDVELWERELYEAGWLKQHGNVYRSPSGLYYRGPYNAWKLMKAHSELNVKTKAER